VRSLIFGIAIVCYAAALAITGAGMRVPVAQPARAVEAAPAALPAAPPSQPLPAPPPEPLPNPAPQPPAGQLQTTVEDLAREQATSRQLVTELRDTVARLQEELTRQSAALHVEEPQGRTVAVLCCDLLPPGLETLGPGVRDVVRSVLPEIVANPRQVVAVEGHTDSRPIRTPADKPFKDNTDLSLMRARAVAALLQKNGVAAGRIQVKGWGDTRPLASNDTAEGRDRNRRVEIRLLPPGKER